MSSDVDYKADPPPLKLSALKYGLKACDVPLFLDRPAGGFPGAIAQAGGLPSKRFISSIGVLQPTVPLIPTA